METIRKLTNNNQDVTIQSTQAMTNKDLQNSFICMSYGNSMNPAFKRAEHEGNLNYMNMSMENICQIYQGKAQSFIEEPIDLTCSGKRSSVDNCISRVPQMHLNGYRCDINKATFIKPSEFRKMPNVLMINNNNRKKRGRKKKYDHNYVQQVQTPPLVPKPTYNSLNTADNKQAEVLKAAKSLFSKRTRTLYHWMYPNAPKTQLKAAVASSWETLGQQEKEFYISQVLGRFGFPQTNLMVNPQLGGLPEILSIHQLTNSQDGHQETSTAVSTLLMSESENLSAWNSNNQNSSVRVFNSPCSKIISRKRSRLGRPPGSKNRKISKETVAIISQFPDESNTDEFRDDPELSREFQQFQWTLQLNDSDTS